MTYRVKMPERYRKYFTVADLDTIKAIKADPEIDSEIKSLIDILREGTGELLKLELEWGYNHRDPESTYFGNGVDIEVHAIFMHEGFSVHDVHATLAQIAQKESGKQCGYGNIYTLDTHYSCY